MYDNILFLNYTKLANYINNNKRFTLFYFYKFFNYIQQKISIQKGSNLKIKLNPSYQLQG